MNGKKTVQKTSATAITKRPESEVSEIQTGQIVRTTEEEFGLEVSRLISQAGTIDLKPAQAKVLYAPVDEKLVEIRPDGLIYLPWMEYVTRLRDAFKLNWAVVPKGDPKMGENGRSIRWGFYLIIEGKLAGGCFAIGEQEYQPDNPKMNWGDCCEGAKSNALMRLCKGIGIGLELWQPSFIEKWKKKYAYSYKSKTKKDRWGNPLTLWRKKGEKEEEPEQAEEPETKKQEEPRRADKEIKEKAEASKKKEAMPTPTPTKEAKITDESASSAAQKKEDIIRTIDATLKEKTIDRIRFKDFLFDYQKGKINTITGEPRIFVELNEHQKLSMHCGNIADLELLATYIADAIDKYIDWSPPKETEEESPF